MTSSLSKKFASLVAVLVWVVLLRTATLAEPRKVEGVIVGKERQRDHRGVYAGGRAGVSAGRQHEGVADERVVQGAADGQVDGGSDPGAEGQSGG